MRAFHSNENGPILHPSSLCCPSFSVVGKRQAGSSHLNEKISFDQDTTVPDIWWAIDSWSGESWRTRPTLEAVPEVVALRPGKAWVGLAPVHNAVDTVPLETFGTIPALLFAQELRALHSGVAGVRLRRIKVKKNALKKTQFKLNHLTILPVRMMWHLLRPRDRLFHFLSCFWGRVRTWRYHWPQNTPTRDGKGWLIQSCLKVLFCAFEASSSNHLSLLLKKYA